MVAKWPNTLGQHNSKNLLFVSFNETGSLSSPREFTDHKGTLGPAHNRVDPSLRLLRNEHHNIKKFGGRAGCRRGSTQRSAESPG